MNRRGFLSLFLQGPIYLPFVNQGTRPIWEYTQVRVNINAKGEPLATLNQMGLDGWQLGSTIHDHTGTAVFILMRKK